MLHLMLTTLLHSFNWKFCDGVSSKDIDVEEKVGITLQKAQPLQAIPLLRERDHKGWSQAPEPEYKVMNGPPPTVPESYHPRHSRRGTDNIEASSSVQESLSKGKGRHHEQTPRTLKMPTPSQIEEAIRIMQTVAGSMRKKGKGQQAPSTSRGQSRSTHRGYSHGRDMGNTQRRLDMDEEAYDKDQNPILEIEVAMHGPHQGTYLHGRPVGHNTHPPPAEQEPQKEKKRPTEGMPGEQSTATLDRVREDQGR
ncbi:Geraniol 8-hydroxylase [Bienertia sinuspersici]